MDAANVPSTDPTSSPAGSAAAAFLTSASSNSASLVAVIQAPSILPPELHEEAYGLNADDTSPHKQPKITTQLTSASLYTLATANNIAAEETPHYHLYAGSRLPRTFSKNRNVQDYEVEMWAIRAYNAAEEKSPDGYEELGYVDLEVADSVRVMFSHMVESHAGNVARHGYLWGAHPRRDLVGWMPQECLTLDAPAQWQVHKPSGALGPTTTTTTSGKIGYPEEAGGGRVSTPERTGGEEK